MIPVAAGDTVRLWNEFKNAKTGHYTSVFRPGILGRAEVERSRLAFWVSAFGLALDVVLTPIETLSLIKARAARQAAHADDLAPISFPDKDPLDGIPWEQRLGGQLPDGQIIPGVYCGGIEAVDDIPVNFFPKEVQEGFRNKHWDKVSMMYVSHSPWEVPEDLLTNNNEGLYKLMQEMTIGYNKEFAAYRRLGTDGLFDEGPVYLMIGAGDTVELPADAHLLAHTHPSGNTWMSVIAKQEGDKIVPMPIRQGDLNVSWYHNPKNPDIVATIITPNHIVSYRIPYNTKIPVLTTYGWVEMETVNLW